MRVSEVDCRTALSPSRLPGLDYALNPYRGCAFACAYCYSPAVLREARSWGSFVEARRNIPYVLAKELKSRPPGVVGIGTVTDAYQPLEGRYKLTRFCLEQLVRYDFPISIQTKSPLLLRDLDILDSFRHADVGFSICTLDDDLRRLFEPGAPPTRARLSALERVASSGIDTWAFLGPILPGVTETHVDELVQLIASTGTKVVVVDRLRVRPLIWENLRRTLEDHPALEYVHRRALWEDPGYFEGILRRIRRLCREVGLVCEDAFPTRTLRRQAGQRPSGPRSTTPKAANRRESEAGVLQI